jgi:pSer/pThr/pTyr-binding forkhead associated (FHA) protein
MKISLKCPSSWDGIDEIHIDRYPFIVGRHRDADCSLPLAFISRQHCQFRFEEDRILIQDLESYNGTFVNGRRITQPTPVHHGDEVSMGPICFRVTIHQTITETEPDYRFMTTHKIPTDLVSKAP